MADIERRARELAMIHGGRIVLCRHGLNYTNAYLILTREGEWRWGRGLHTGDLLATYIDLHWRDFEISAERETS
jgi:hypothetical protein